MSAQLAPVDAAPAVSVRGLEVSARGRHGAEIPVVRGIDLEVRRGETLGIVGESGSGKSLTALSLLRLLPENLAQKGEIAIDGDDLARMGSRKLRAARGARVSMIFQDPMTGLNPLRTIGSTLIEVLRRHNKISRKEAAQRAVEGLRSVGIPSPQERMSVYPHQLSGGLRQRVMIAMALLNDPVLIIGDEPTTALDATVQAQILDLLRQRVADAALIMITHDLGVAFEVCDRIAVMYAGRIVETGAAQELMRNPRHPYTRGLLAAAPSFDAGRQALVSIPGMPPSPGQLPPGCPFGPRCPQHVSRCDDQEPPLLSIPASTIQAACWRVDD